MLNEKFMWSIWNLGILEKASGISTIKFLIGLEMSIRFIEIDHTAKRCILWRQATANHKPVFIKQLDLN